MSDHEADWLMDQNNTLVLSDPDHVSVAWDLDETLIFGDGMYTHCQWDWSNCESTSSVCSTVCEIKSEPRESFHVYF